MRFTDYIWDFDGTLFDSYPTMTRGMVVALSRFGIQADYADVLFHMKKSVGKCCVHFAEQCGADPQAISDVFQTTRNDEHTPLYPGARDACLAIVKNGGRNFLYSHRDETAWASLAENGLREAFTGGVISTDAFPSKPAPDALNHLCAQYGIDRSQAVMVGDRDIDLLAGRNAGIEGFLFDPDGYYKDFDTPLRAATYDEFMRLCGIRP